MNYRIAFGLVVSLLLFTSGAFAQRYDLEMSDQYDLPPPSRDSGGSIWDDGSGYQMLDQMNRQKQPRYPRNPAGNTGALGTGDWNDRHPSKASRGAGKCYGTGKCKRCDGWGVPGPGWANSCQDYYEREANKRCRKNDWRCRDQVRASITGR